MLVTVGVPCFQSLQEYPKLDDGVSPNSDSSCFQSLQEYPKLRRLVTLPARTPVSNPYRNILSEVNDEILDNSGAFPILTGIS